MPKRILLVDDEEIITNMLAEFFVQAGYDLTEAMNGREAIEIA